MPARLTREHNGRFRRSSENDIAHSMLTTWAAHILLMYGSSEGQGYTIGILQDYSGLPPHSLIPKGVEYTSQDDIRINNWLEQTRGKIRENVYKYYLFNQRITKDQHNYLLGHAANFIFRSRNV